MHPAYLDILKRRFSLKEVEGPSKVMPLGEAVKRFVKPGMTLHFGQTHCRPYGFCNEIVRQFWNKRPGFTLVMLGFVGNPVVLAYNGQLKKIMSCFCGDAYPTPGPNRILQQARRDGTIEFEHYSILTLPLRLLAGAMNVPWMPTNSFAGSTLADDNSDIFVMVDDPKKRGEKFGMLRALNPDLSLVHAWCADEAGNALMTPPYGENVFGALASKNGVLVAVEEIVSTEFIRRHASLVKIPGHVVKSVSVCKLGVHPSGMTNVGIPEFGAYAEDYEFIEEHRRACKKDETYDEWIKHWILECATREEYLSRLGNEKISFLKAKAAPDSWESELEGLSENLDPAEHFNKTERMIVTASRMAAASIRKNKYNTILAGVGASNLAAWLATMSCKEEGLEVECMAEIGFYGYMPRPGDPYIFNHRNVHTCKMLTSVDTVMGMLAGGATNRCIGLIGAAQVDPFGNVNTTWIPSTETFIVGSGGANDVASGASEMLVCIEQSKERTPPELPYITSPGKSVRTLVTDLGIFEKLEEKGELILTAVYEDSDSNIEGIEESVNNVRNNTGWEVKVNDHVREEPPPTHEELLTLRLFDPRRQFIGKPVGDET